MICSVKVMDKIQSLKPIWGFIPNDNKIVEGEGAYWFHDVCMQGNWFSHS